MARGLRAEDHRLARSARDDGARAQARRRSASAHIAIGCALSYLDFRFAEQGWRTGRPLLAAWHAAFEHPAFGPGEPGGRCLRPPARARSPHVRVLDLSRIMAGPWAGQILADLGADVIKVERPGVGDDTRALGPAVSQGRSTASRRARPAITSRSIAASARSRSTSTSPKARRSCARSRRDSDIVLENFKVGTLERFGLDYDGLKAVNPRHHLLLDHRLRPDRAEARRRPPTTS